MTLLIRDFATRVKGYVDDSPSASLLVQKNSLIFATFNKKIISTIPDFRPFVDENDMKIRTAQQKSNENLAPVANSPPVFLKDVKEYIDK